MKLLFDSNESIDYLQRNDLVRIDFGECTIRTGEISTQLKRLSQLESDFPQMVEQELKQKLTPLLEENRTLKSQLEEKIQPVEKYEVQIKELQSQIENLKKQINDFGNKTESLEKSNQELQDKKKDLETTVVKLNKISTDEEEINQIYERVGSYKKVKNKVKLIALWDNDPNLTLRQIELIRMLEGQFSEAVIKIYIRELISSKVLIRTDIQGSYRLNVSNFDKWKVDFDRLCSILLGDIYENAVAIRIEKNKSEREPDY